MQYRVACNCVGLRGSIGGGGMYKIIQVSVGQNFYGKSLEGGRGCVSHAGRGKPIHASNGGRSPMVEV